MPDGDMLTQEELDRIRDRGNGDDLIGHVECFDKDGFKIDVATGELCPPEYKDMFRNRRGGNEKMGVAMGTDMDPITTKCLELLKEVEGKNVPITVNNPTYKGVVFVYSGDNWEAFSEAIRQAVDKVQEALLERKAGKP